MIQLDRSRALLAPLAIAALLAPAPAARAQQQEPPAEERRLTFTFRRASIQAFLGYLSREGGFTFLQEAAVQGDIDAIAEGPLTRDEALEVLRGWLLPRDRTILRTGDVVRIVTLEDAKRRGLPVRVGSDPAQINDTDELVTQVMPLKYVQAEQVKSQLEGLLSDQGVLMIEPTGNSLVVRDTSASIRRFAEVLKALDQAVTAELQVKVYRLKNSDAVEVAKVISELFSGVATAQQQQGNNRGGRGRRGRGNNFREMAQMFFAGRGGAPGTAGAQTSPVQVSTDPRTNAVVVTASTDQLRLIDSLIAELDRDEDPVVTELRVFPLKNADAAALAETITALFAEEQQPQRGRGRGGRGGGGDEVPRWVQRMIPGMEDAGGDEDGSVTDRYAPPPKVTTDQRTNSLIVSATQRDLLLVEKLVADLDKDPTESSAVLVLPLRHATAESLATTLGDALAQNQTTAAGGGGRNQNQRGRGRGRQAQPAATSALSTGLVGEVTVTADTEANALLFTTSPRNFDRLRTIVNDLDRARREVFIECLIAEVQLTDRGELGIQWNAAFTNSVENAEEGSQTLGTDWGLDSLADGLRWTTSSDKLTGLLRALKTEGRLNILSSPKILVLENADSEISVGQEVPFVTNSRITQNGDTVNTIQYRDVGIILRVTPQVNEDGYVRMVVHPEVSSIAPDSESVPISEGVRSPTFNKNFADTTIVVRTGETAVIGGLIRDSWSESRFKIPVLGDIPVLGHLFGSTSREKVKQEIVVFLTPHVVEDAGELRDRSRKAREQFALVPPEVLQAELERWLRELEEGTHAFHYNRGTVLLEGGRLVEAIEELERAVELSPGDAATRLNLGLALARAGALERAATALQRAALLDGADPEISYNLGAVYWRLGDFPRAAAELRRALQIDPRHEGAATWLPRAMRQLQRLERGLLEEEDK